MSKKKKQQKKPTGPWWKRNPVWLFLGGFGLIMTAFYAFWLTDFFHDNILTPWIHVNTRAAGFILNLIGQEVTVRGDIVAAREFAISVKQGCDAIEPTMLFVAGVFSFPVLWRNKLIGIPIGAAFLMFMNLLRIVSLFLIGRYASQEIFEMMHIDVWQVIFIFLALISWYVWLRWAMKDFKNEKAQLASSAA